MLPTAFFAIFTATVLFGLTDLCKYMKDIERMTDDVSDLHKALLGYERLSAPVCRDCTEKTRPGMSGNEKPTDHVIVLWWGPDGLRLNEDGTAEWISASPTIENPEASYTTLRKQKPP